MYHSSDPTFVLFVWRPGSPDSPSEQGCNKVKFRQHQALFYRMP